MCGESRTHGVEWGKTRRLPQRVTYHYPTGSGVRTMPTITRRSLSETILEIKVSHKTTSEMAVAYGFTPRQNEQLVLLSDPQYDALWMTLLGGYVSGGGQIITPGSDWAGTGIFAWPLPRSFTITSILDTGRTHSQGN